MENIPVPLEFDSLLLGTEPEGCVHCRQGAKMVLLVTGICSYSCYYCPISEKKKGNDVIYANELMIDTEDPSTINSIDRLVIDEAMTIDAQGTGITGGDPLIVPERTMGFIKLLKTMFGNDHHIHLYTASTPGKELLQQFALCGLDEIRYHLVNICEPGPIDLSRKKALEPYIESIEDSIACGLETGIEIPVFPDSLNILKWLLPEIEKTGMSFLNLNELEFSPTNYLSLESQGYIVCDDISSAVMGSRETAYEFIHWAASRNTRLTIHFCSSRYKDAGQLRKRLERRARNVVKPYEIMTEDSTLILGIIEVPQMELPGIMNQLIEDYEIPTDLIIMNSQRNRIEIAPWILEEISEDLDFPSYIIEEYPTADRLEVEREQLNNIETSENRLS